jgi:hypothetical protein
MLLEQNNKNLNFRKLVKLWSLFDLEDAFWGAVLKSIFEKIAYY